MSLDLGRNPFTAFSELWATRTPITCMYSGAQWDLSLRDTVPTVRKQYSVQIFSILSDYLICIVSCLDPQKHCIIEIFAIGSVFHCTSLLYLFPQAATPGQGGGVFFALSVTSRQGTQDSVENDSQCSRSSR